MVSLEKCIILTPLQKLTKNGEDWGKLIVAKGFKKLPKVQNIAQSGHTGQQHNCLLQQICSMVRTGLILCEQNPASYFHRLTRDSNLDHYS